MQDENNVETREEGGISLSEIIRVIAVQKWLALILAAAITLFGTLAIFYGYNRTKQQYVVDFSLVLPGMDNKSAVYTYPDGKTFQYADMVSKDVLTAIKDSSVKYSGIDVNAVVTGGDISVVRIVSEEKNEVTYSLRVNADVFPSENVAADFLKEVVNEPKKYVANMLLDYDVYLSLSQKAEDYESQLELLNSQLEYILRQYNTLIANYGENMVANGKTLSSQINEINSYYNKNDIGILLAKVREEGILKSEELIEKLKLQRIDYDRQHKIAKATLDNLLKGSPAGDGSAETPEADGGKDTIIYFDAKIIKEQSDLVATLQQKMDDIDRYINNKNINPDFEQSHIKPQQEILKGFTERLNKTVVEVYAKSSSVAYLNAGFIKTEGGMGLVKSLILSLAVGVIVALIVAYICGKYKLNKAKNVPVAVKSEPSPAETQPDGNTADGENQKE